MNIVGLANSVKLTWMSPDRLGGCAELTPRVALQKRELISKNDVKKIYDVK